MSILDEEVNALAELGATTGQIEHRMIELGVFENDRPTADVWWWLNHGTCEKCCPTATESEEKTNNG